MRRIILGVVAVAALAAGAIAIAGPPGSGTTSVTGTFTTTTVSKLKTRTCTGPDGSYTFTDAHYAGTAVSTDSHLSGPVTIHAHTVYNTTKNLGTVKGNLRIDTAGPGHTKAKFAAVDSSGTLSGGISGHAGPGTSLVGTFSGSLNPATGFTAGSIGTGGNGAVLSNPKPCPGPKKPKQPKH
jgi:hypothetical protein